MARGDGDWLDKTTLLVAALGLLAASCAAIFAWQSASTARDTEERQLRAYLVLSDFLVVCAECGDTPEPGYPREYTHGRILNSGETPDLPGARSDKLDRLQRHREVRSVNASGL